MKHILLLLLLCIAVIVHSYGQGARMVIEITKGKHRVSTAKVIELTPPRGDTALVAYVERNLGRTIRKNNGARKGKYVAIVQFIVDREGNMADVECIKDPGYGMGAEVVRTLKKAGKWGPGKVTIRRN